MPCYAYQAYKKGGKIEITHEHVPCFRKKNPHCFIHAVLILFFKMGHTLPRDTIPADPVDPWQTWINMNLLIKTLIFKLHLMLPVKSTPTHHISQPYPTLHVVVYFSICDKVLKLLWSLYGSHLESEPDLKPSKGWSSQWASRLRWNGGHLMGGGTPGSPWQKYMTGLCTGKMPQCLIKRPDLACR